MTITRRYHTAVSVYIISSSCHEKQVVGWGTDKADGTPYWVAFNSWGAKWGVNGTFNIAVGQCGFEESVYTATPCLDGEICI